MLSPLFEEGSPTDKNVVRKTAFLNDEHRTKT